MPPAASLHEIGIGEAFSLLRPNGAPLVGVDAPAKVARLFAHFQSFFVAVAVTHASGVLVISTTFIRENFFVKQRMT